MTKLYRLDAPAADVAGAFGARAGNDPWAGGYVSPAGFAPVVTAGREAIAGPRRGKGERRIAPRVWGVPPPPNVPYDGRNGVTSVSNPDSPFWIGNLRNSEFRCIVPATAIMLWGSGTDYEGRRLRHWFAPEQGGVSAMAGVWKDEDVPAFAILTRDAGGAPGEAGCSAMPVVLPDSERARQAWLHGGWDEARRVIDAPAPLIEIEPTRSPARGP